MKAKKRVNSVRNKILLYSLAFFFFAFYVLNMCISLKHLNIEAKVRRFEFENFYGFYLPEKEDNMTFSWTRKEAEKILTKKGNIIYIPIGALRPNISTNNVEVTITVNDVISEEFILDSNDWKLISINLSEINDNYIKLKFSVDKTWKPAELLKNSTDYRILGIRVGPIYWE